MGQTTWLEQREAAQAFCREHLKECCEEMVEYSETAVLRNGRVRELARMCSFAQHDALAVAEAMVKHEALKAVASQPKVEVGPKC